MPGLCFFRSGTILVFQKEMIGLSKSPGLFPAFLFLQQTVEMNPAAFGESPLNQFAGLNCDIDYTPVYSPAIA